MDLLELRTRIDELDRQLVYILERRMDVSQGVAEYKSEHDLPVLDEKREAEKLASIKAMCRPETAEMLESVFEAVMAASRAYQTKLMEERHG